MSPLTASTATLPYALAAWREEAPDAPMLIDAVTDRRVTIGQFDEQNRAWARRFAAMGIGSGQTVATIMGPSLDAYNAWLGLAGLGAVEVPINPQLVGRSLLYLLNHSAANILVIHAAYLKQVAQIAGSLVHLRTIIVADLEGPVDPGMQLPFRLMSASEFRSHEIDVEYRLAERHDTACIIYTSGTTGPSKGVVIPWGWMTLSLLVPSRVTGGTRYSYLSPAHMSGKCALNSAVSEKRTLVLRETFSVREFWNDIAKYDCRVTQLFPPMIKYLLAAAPQSPKDRQTPLRYIWTAPLIPETREFMQRFNIAVTTGFGSTEIGGPIAGIDVDGTNLESCGTVNPDPVGYEVRIVDEFDRELPPGQVGELIVRTSTPWTLNAGYHRNPEATASAWRNGWFHTGDAMTKDEQGNFHFVDRYKDCIRRKGENISSFEVEEYALSYPGVAEAAAVGITAADGEQEVKIFLLAKTGASLDLEAMGTWLQENMPKFMTPRYLEVLQEFPRTPTTARVQKNLLRSQAPGPGQWDRSKSAGNETPRGPSRATRSA